MNTTPSRILVVDDEEDNCANLQDILSDMGHQVDVAYSGEQALELIAHTPYDIALLDLKMPGMDGVELYRRIKKLRAGTVAIVVTAYASSETAEKAREAGAWQILSKPVDFSKLLRLLDDAIEQPLILIVDDDQDLCYALWDLLCERGCRVALAHDIQEAEERFKDQSFRVVLIDMKLPQGDGPSVFRLVQRSNPQARTVLITGLRNQMAETIEKLLAEGADAVCYKPFNVPELLDTLKRLSTEKSSSTQR